MRKIFTVLALTFALLSSGVAPVVADGEPTTACTDPHGAPCVPAGTTCTDQGGQQVCDPAVTCLSSSEYQALLFERAVLISQKSNLVDEVAVLNEQTRAHLNRIAYLEDWVSDQRDQIAKQRAQLLRKDRIIRRLRAQLAGH